MVSVFSASNSSRRGLPMRSVPLSTFIIFTVNRSVALHRYERVRRHSLRTWSEWNERLENQARTSESERQLVSVYVDKQSPLETGSVRRSTSHCRERSISGDVSAESFDGDRRWQTRHCHRFESWGNRGRRNHSLWSTDSLSNRCECRYPPLEPCGTRRRTSILLGKATWPCVEDSFVCRVSNPWRCRRERLRDDRSAHSWSRTRIDRCTSTSISSEWPESSMRVVAWRRSSEATNEVSPREPESTSPMLGIARFRSRSSRTTISPLRSNEELVRWTEQVLDWTKSRRIDQPAASSLNERLVKRTAVEDWSTTNLDCLYCEGITPSTSNVERRSPVRTSIHNQSNWSPYASRCFDRRRSTSDS